MRIDRRHFIGAAAGGGAAAALSAWFPAWAQPVSAGLKAQLPTVSGEDITLRIARQTMRIDGKISRAIGINGTIPGPLIRLKNWATIDPWRARRIHRFFYGPEIAPRAPKTDGALHA